MNNILQLMNKSRNMQINRNEKDRPSVSVFRKEDRMRTIQKKVLVALLLVILITCFQGAALGEKTLSILGDSISAYKGYIPDGYEAYYDGETAGVLSVEQMWWSIVAGELGYRISTVNAWSGSRVATIENPESAMCMDRTGQLAENGIPDVIIILGGVNDFLRVTPLGNWENQAEPGSETFRQAYAMMLEKIRANYPDADVWCCTLPVWEWDGEPDDPETSGGQTKVDFDEAIRIIAGDFDCGVIELDHFGITRENLQLYVGDYIEKTGTGLHPNAAGQELIARKIIQALK